MKIMIVAVHDETELVAPPSSLFIAVEQTPAKPTPGAVREACTRLGAECARYLAQERAERGIKPDGLP